MYFNWIKLELLYLLLMSQTVFDNITRSSIWTTYNCICFYCNRPLDWDDLHIDHIIPECYDKNLKQLEKIKINYELSEKFDLNSMNNLVLARLLSPRWVDI